MFSAAEDGASPTTTQYAYAEPGSGVCINYVADLKPNVIYSVVTSVATGTRTVQITEGTGSINLTADLAGCLIFDPATLVPFTGLQGSFSDALPIAEGYVGTPKQTVAESVALVENYSEFVIIATANDRIDDTLALTEAYRQKPGGVLDDSLAVSEAYRSKPTETKGETCALSESWGGTVLPGPPPIPPPPGKGKRKGKIDRIIEFLDHRIDRGGDL
jgi:hypothetical protein